MKIYAVIPARSGSKGVPNKNIRMLENKHLIGYSIEFAKRMGVDKIICSTDSEEYAEIAKSYGAEVPFLRSDFASEDTAMEQDILIDMYNKFDDYDIAYPDLFVWLRPTFVFRDINLIRKAINQMRDTNLSSCRIVVEAESRLYKIKENNLIANFEDHGKSMIRRQDVEKSYKVYSTDIFRGDYRNVSDNFLGDKVGYVIADKICGLDIDDEIDFKIVENLIKFNKELVDEYL